MNFSLPSLFADDDNSSNGKKHRPGWTVASKSLLVPACSLLLVTCMAAETKSKQLSSLADLEQKALFLPRSAISQRLETIGQGKLFTG